MIDKLIDWKDRTDFTEYYLAITRRREFVRDEYRSEADKFYIRWPADKRAPEFPYWVEWGRDPLGYYWRFVVYIGRFPECVRETIENEFRRELSYDWNVKSTVEWIPSDSCTPNDKKLAMLLEEAGTEESARWVFCRHDTLKDLEYDDYEAERYFHPVYTQPTTSQPSTANNVVEAVDVAAVDAAVRDRVAADRVVAADTLREADLVVADHVARVVVPDRRQTVDDVAADTAREAGQPSTTAGNAAGNPNTKKQSDEEYLAIKDHFERSQLMHGHGFSWSEIGKWEDKYRDELDSDPLNPLPSTSGNAIHNRKPKKKKL